MMQFEHIDPNNYIGYWLFYTQRCVAYAFSEIMRAYCVEQDKPYVVTPPQWGVLALLLLEGEQTVGAISQKRGIDPPTVTGIVKRLEQSGLVERRHSREDRRVVKVHMTDEGRATTQALSPRILAFNDEMLRDFSENERQHLLQMLQRIIANLSNSELGIGDRFNLLPEYIVRPDYGVSCETPPSQSSKGHHKNNKQSNHSHIQQ